ncbi:MAG: GntR family transcriptional regulator [Deltaproteobacteria bacterium]|nr:GntR family transcriptional regulator [Deltaproteobacteria bacterium]
MTKNQSQQDLLEKITNDILCGEFGPRERLVESDIMKKYMATRNAVRSVFKELQMHKLLVHQPNRGVTVVRLTEKDAIDLYKVRALLESSAAYQIVAGMTETRLEDLRGLQQEFIAAVLKRDLRNISQANHSFHEKIFQSVENRVLFDFIMDLRTRSNLLLYHIRRHPGKFEESIQDHDHLLVALTNRNPEDFIKVNSRHVMGSLHAYLAKPLAPLGLEKVAQGSFSPPDLLELLS